MDRQQGALGTRELASVNEVTPDRDDPVQARPEESVEPPLEGAIEEPVREHDAQARPLEADAGAPAPAGGGATEDAGAMTGAGATSLLPENENTEYQRRWEGIQTAFVDDPRRAVEQADALVATVMQRLAEGFAREREGLEAQWGRGEDISTEELRVSLQRYRSFFQRLLSA